MQIEDIQKRLTLAERNITDIFQQIATIKKLLKDAHIGDV